MQNIVDAQSHMPKQFNILLHPATQKFLAKLSPEEKARSAKAIELLKQEGPGLVEPHASFLDGELKELKFRFNQSFFRYIYLYDKKKEAYVIVHCFKKQTNQTPEQEKEVARKRAKTMKLLQK